MSSDKEVPPEHKSPEHKYGVLHIDEWKIHKLDEHEYCVWFRCDFWEAWRIWCYIRNLSYEKGVYYYGTRLRNEKRQTINWWETSV